MTLQATVVDGQIVLADLDLSALEGQQVRVTIERSRSSRQNRYFHWIVRCISEYTGYETYEVKAFLKDLFGIESTAGLSAREFAEFLDACVRWAAIELHLVIPSPERAQ